VAAARRHPLARALRYDKTRAAVLQATLEHYLRGEADTGVGFWRLATAAPDRLRLRAESIAAGSRLVGTNGDRGGRRRVGARRRGRGRRRGRCPRVPCPTPPS
jgi:L-seryl-tRNA(Ser) seleniumtransferase